MNARSQLLDKVTATLSDADKPPRQTPERTKSSVLGRRTEAADAIRSGKKTPVVQIRHPTSRIRMWHFHNRDYEALDAESCKDLIEGFQRANGQQMPALVRKVTDTDEFDYEVICGARRHWTASYLNADLIIEVRDIDDRAAFILQDLENRDRLDVSDLERARDYRRALPLYFNDDQSGMANYLNMDPGNFNRLLSLTELPDEVINAYADSRQLRVHHGVVYRKMLSDPKQKKKLLNRAVKLEREGLNGQQVFAKLRAVDVSSVPKIKAGNATLLRATKKHLNVQLSLPAKVTAQTMESLEKDVAKLLNRMREQLNVPPG